MTTEPKVTARYEAVADAFRAAMRESSLLVELGKRRSEAAKAVRISGAKGSRT